MPNQQLLDFIQKETQAGISREEIKSSLIKNGWQDVDVESGFSALGMNGQVPVAKVATVVPVAPVVPSNITQSQQVALSNGFIVSRPMTAPAEDVAKPLNVASNLDISKDTASYHGNNVVAKTSGGSKAKIIVSLIVILFVLILGSGGVWAYFTYVSPDPQTTINKSLVNLASQISQKGLMNGQTDFELKANGTLPQQTTVSSVDLTMNSDAVSDIKEGKSSAELSFKLVLDAGPTMNLNIDGQNFLSVVYDGSKAFMRINSIPSGLEKYSSTWTTSDQFDLIKKEVIGKWIEVDKGQISSIGGAYGIGSDIPAGSRSSLSADDLSVLAKAMSDSNLFAYDETLPSDTIDGQSVLHYRAKLNKAGLKDFINKSLSVIGSGQSVQSIDLQSIDKNIDNAFAQYESSGIDLSFEVYIGRYSKLPVKIIADIESNNSDMLKQIGVSSASIVASATYGFPTISNISAPSDYITMAKAMSDIKAITASSTSSKVASSTAPSKKTTSSSKSK